MTHRPPPPALPGARPGRRGRSRSSGPGWVGTAGRMAVLMALAVLPALAFPAASRAQTILNVERLQPGDVTRWHWGVEGSLSLSQGNTDATDVLAGVVTGYRWPDDWLRVFAGLQYHSETGEDLENDRYLHLRYNHWLSERWQSFHFVQLQASHDNLLRRRYLVGSGLRRRLFDGRTTLDVGTGAMYEREELDPAQLRGSHPVESRVWRMANLLVATRRLTETVRLISVAYVQPDLARFGDLRTLTDLSVLIQLTESVDLGIRGEWRHDSRPPEGRDHDDLVLRTGFTVSFR